MKNLKFMKNRWNGTGKKVIDILIALDDSVSKYKDFVKCVASDRPK